MNVLIDLYRNCAKNGAWQPLNDKEKEYIELARNGNSDAWLELYDYAWYTVITLWFGRNNSKPGGREEKNAFKERIRNVLTSMLVYAESYTAYNEAESPPRIGEVCEKIVDEVVGNLLKKYDLERHNGIRAYYGERIPGWNAKWAEFLRNKGDGDEKSKMQTVADSSSPEKEPEELPEATPINICKAIVNETGYVVRNLAETPNPLSQVGASPVDFCRALFLKLNERQENA